MGSQMSGDQTMIKQVQIKQQITAVALGNVMFLDQL